MATKLQARGAVKLRQAWSDAGVPDWVTGQEAARLSVQSVGFVAPGLVRTNTPNHTRPISLAHVAMKVAEASNHSRAILGRPE